MTTMTSEAPVWSVDLLGRPAVVDHEMTTVTALRGTEVFTAHEPGTGREAEAVVMLPVTGEFVEMPDVMPGNETVKGYWLGPVETGTRVHETFSVFVLSGSTVHRLVLPVAKADARQVVTGRASEGERAAMGALLEQSRAHAATVQTHSQWWTTSWRLRIPRPTIGSGARSSTTSWTGWGCPQASHIQRMQRWGRSSSGRPQHLVTRLQSIEPCSTEVTCGAIHALAAMGE